MYNKAIERGKGKRKESPMKRNLDETAVIEFLAMLDNEKEIESRIYETEQAYIWTWDDEEALSLRNELRNLKSELHEAQKARKTWAANLK